MKILHVVPTYLPAVRYGGPIYSVHGLAAAQAALGNAVSVFTTNADGDGVSDVPIAKPIDLDGVAITYFDVGSPRRLYRTPAMGRALAARIGDFDVVHLHSVFLWPTLVAARAAYHAGVPYVLSPRGMLVARLIRAKSTLVKHAWLTLFERRTIREAAALHVTAQREAEDFAELGLATRRIIEIPNGVDLPGIYDPEALAPDVARAISGGPYALYLGRLNWKKNLPNLIAALRGISELRLVIAGNDEEGHLDQIKLAIRNQDLADRVTLIPRNVSGDDKSALFSCCALFILPSINENFGNTVLEAMAHGRPVVVSNAAGVAEVVCAARCGLVTAPEPDRLAAAITALCADPAEARAMGERGARAAADTYSWRAVALRMDEAYTELLRLSRADSRRSASSRHISTSA